MRTNTRHAWWLALIAVLALGLAGCYRSVGGSLEPTQPGKIGVVQPTFTPLDAPPTVEEATGLPSPIPSPTPFPTLAPPTDVSTLVASATPVAQPTDVVAAPPVEGQGGGPEEGVTAGEPSPVIPPTDTPEPPTNTPRPPTSTSTPTPRPTNTRTPTPVVPTLGPTLTFTAVPFTTFPPSATYTPYTVASRPIGGDVLPPAEAQPLAERPTDVTGETELGVGGPVFTVTPPVVSEPVAVAQVPTLTPVPPLPTEAPAVALQATLTGGQMTATQIVYGATATAAATLGIQLPTLTPIPGQGGPGVIYVTATPFGQEGQPVIYITATPVIAGGVCGEHLVAPGETLFRLAQRYNVTVDQFAQANNIVNPDLIRAGDTLIVPCTIPATPTPIVTPFVPDGAGGQAGVYTVQPGDNIYRIALKFGVSMTELMGVNGIGPAQMNSIYVGQTLVIPASAVQPTPTAIPGQGGGPVYIVVTATPVIGTTG